MQRLNHKNNQFLEQELIRKYLADTLSREEELMVAEKYQNDEDFRDALDGLESLTLEEYDELMNSVDDKLSKKFLKNTVGVENEIQEQKIPRINSYRKLAIAASLLLLLGLGSAILFSQVKGPNQKVFAKHFEYKAYPDMITRGAGEELSNLEKTAISAYNAENYEVSTEHFKSLSQKYPDNIKYNLFLGISYMGANEPGMAIKALERSPYDKSTFCNDINWYLGLAYLKVKNNQKAKEIFTKLSAADCYYQDAAKEILNKL